MNPATQAKLIGWAIYAGVGVAALLVLLWALIIRPARDAKQVVAAKAGQVVADGRAAAAKDTTRLIERHFTTVREIERNADAALANIRAAQSPADLQRAGVAAVCMLAPAASVAADPGCALRRSDPRQPES